MEVAILLGWLGAKLEVVVYISVVLVLLDFCMALVPSLGKEFVLCCLLAEVEDIPLIIMDVVDDGWLEFAFSSFGELGGESSESLART